MSDDQFEAIVRSLFDSPSRRAMLRAITGTTLASWLGLASLQAYAKKGKKGGKRKKGKGKKGKGKKKKKLKTVFYSANPMLGANEVGGGDPNGSGSAHFSVKGDTICGTFHFASTTAMSNVIGTHIHQGPPGVNGPIVVNFTGPVNQEACVKCPSDICEKLEDNPGGYYANTHTGAFPNGAIRAQLVKG